MEPSNPSLNVAIDTRAYVAVLSSAVARHVGDLRVALRSFEDGSFETKASMARPGTLLHFAIASDGLSGAAATRLCNRCFVSIVGELVTYLDRMIAAHQVVEKGLTLPNGLTAAGVREFLREEMEREYREVAGDTRLSNPKKLRSFQGVAEIATNSALSYFDVRRALEHHGGRPMHAITLWYGRLKLVAGEIELTQPGQAAPENTGISLGMNHESRLLPPGQDIVIEEQELEHIMFTIQHLIAPEVQRVAARPVTPMRDQTPPKGSGTDAGAA